MAMSAELALLQRVCTLQLMQHVYSALFVCICVAVTRRGVLVRVSLVNESAAGVGRIRRNTTMLQLLEASCNTI
jgi:hypothetical protein